MASSVPELQQKLFKRMGLDVPEQSQPRNPRQGRRPGQQLSRKEQRKAQRVQKKGHVYARAPQPERRVQQQAPRRTQPPTGTKPVGAQTPQPQLKSSLKKPKVPNPIEVDPDEDEGEDEDKDEDEDEDEDDTEVSLGESEDGDVFGDDDDEVEDGVEDDEDNEETEPRGSGKTKSVPKAVQDRLAQDDAEIDEFERKLGIKKGRKSLPQAFKEDGLDELMGDLDAGVEQSDDDEAKVSSKRKSEYDEWLASKRRKTELPTKPAKGDEDDEDLSMKDDSDLDEDGDDDVDGFDEESFDGFDSDTEGRSPAQPRQRENPYVAPTTGVTVAKYVPPSLRKAAGSEEESKARLRRQVQGLINRLTDANILSIVQSFEELYQKNARGDVTEIITDAIMAQICKPESMPDQFFVLTGGFAAAIYRLHGSSFGGHLIRRIVTDIGTEYDRASKGADDQSAILKEVSNIMTLLSQLYVFEVVTCKILFDYMERLLSDLSEMNVELLLRICRMAGRLMRKDDPQSLKHVSTVLNQEVAKASSANVSVRTKFMIETITDLRNSSKPKARGLDSAVVSEHVQRMKKRLGELKSQSRRMDGLAPMGVGLVDIEGADTRGKWWLVGASVPTNLEKKRDPGGNLKGDGNDSTDDEDMDFVLPDYPKKARAQGFSGQAQIAIFTALMSASDFEHGYRQFVNLRLKKDDQLEIARVLIQCVGSEAQYNPYYALVGRQACINNRLRFAFQDRLWKIFRGLGESLFGEEPDDDETADGERMKDERRTSNVARFYASLVADGALTITILKPLDLPELNPWTSIFVQWFIIALLQECKGKGAKEGGNVEKHFGAARELPGLAAGIHWILRKKIRKTKLLSSKEAKKLEGVREKAQTAVQAVADD
ncbi:Fc.00g012950.m01.CDS01 [Cosmosporella sp. VM-42]